MIISTGTRTDIPAFYSKWFINRIKEGYVLVRNPYFPNLVFKYLLDPSLVDCLCFTSKNPSPIIKYLDELSKFKIFFFVSITCYEKDVEVNVPNKNIIVDSFKKLSLKLGKNNLVWRYDPIFYNEKYTYNEHLYRFELLCKKLQGYTSSCVISFLDAYDHIKDRIKDYHILNKEEEIQISKSLVNISNKYNIKIKSCAENSYLQDYGIDISGCQSKKVVENAIGNKLKISSYKSARPKCGCLLGNDIGEYSTCMHLCKYCYANKEENVLNNFKRHDENSPLLIGNITDKDKIVIPKQVSYIDRKIYLF